MPSPLEISIGLHYWTRPTAYAEDDENHRNSGAVTSTLEQFVSDGLLERLAQPNEFGGKHKGTEALSVWVAALCAVPFPEQVWVIPK